MKLFFDPFTAPELIPVINSLFESGDRFYAVLQDNRSCEGYIVEQDYLNKPRPAYRPTKRKSTPYILATSLILSLRKSDGELLYKSSKFIPAYQWDKATIAFNEMGTHLWEVIAPSGTGKGRLVAESFATQGQAKHYLDKKKKFES